MAELCGHCWCGRLCVAPDGNAYACVMARQWPVGNVLEAPLAGIVRGDALAGVRTSIHDTVWMSKLSAGRVAAGHATEGQPDEDEERAYPGEGEPTPAECPQSCFPADVPPDCPQTPGECPQTCEPFGCDPLVGCVPLEITSPD